MARTKYYLFVDEVQPTPPFDIYNYSGIVITEEKLHNGLMPGINEIKNRSIGRLGGQTVNLHFNPLSRRKGDFASLTKQEETDLWAGIIDVLQNTNYHIISGLVGLGLRTIYPHYPVTVGILAFRVLLQNFVRFLHFINGYGSIIVEASSSNEVLTREFYQLMYAGSKYLSPKCYQEVFRSIRFEPKENLLEGLQAVDFIANAVSRDACGFNPFVPTGFKDSPFPDIIKSKVYCGPSNQPSEYGIRKVF